MEGTMEVFTLTPKKKAVVDYVLAFLFLLLGAVAFAMAVMLGKFLLIMLTLIFVYLWVLFLFRRNFEYEFAYFDGDFKVVRIANKSRRKLKLQFTLDDVVQMAPVGDRSVYKYENDNTAKHYDFSSHREDAKPYVLVLHSGETTSVLLVEPDEKMLDAICRKGAQKLVRGK